MAQSQVYAVIQDSRGWVWMGTRGGGLTIFDGKKFRYYTQKDGLSSDYIFTLREDPKGNIWIGSNEGLSCFDGKEFTNFKYKAADSSSFWVLDMEFDKEGQLWLASNAGLCLFKDNRIRNMNHKVGLRTSMVNTICFDKNENLWYGTGSGITRYNPKFGSLLKFNRQNGFNFSVNAIACDAKGKLWIGTYGNGLFYFASDSIKKASNDNLLGQSSVFDLLSVSENQLCIATLNQGVIFYNPMNGSFNVVSEKEGLSNNHVRSICRDRTGNYWFGTSGGGISSYFGNRFTLYDKTNSLGGNFIYSLFRDRRGRLIIGNSDKGITIIDSGRISHLDGSNGFRDVKVKAITEDRLGRIFLGTEANGICIFNDSSFQWIHGLEKAYIRALVTMESGDVLAASLGSGIIRIASGDSIPEFMNANNGLLSSRITCLHKDKLNRVWYGTESQGFSYIEGFRSTTKRFQIPELAGKAIRCFSENSKGELRIGTAGKGILVMKIYTPEFSHQLLNTNDGLSSDNIYLITEGNGNSIYSGTENGIDRILIGNDSRVLQVKHYGKNEGFSGIETCQNSVWRDADGSIWFGTVNGLIRYMENSQSANKTEPLTSISDVRLFYEPLAKTIYKNFCGPWNKINSFELPYNQNHLTFDFMGINLSNPDAVRYQWMLKGFDQSWSPVSAQNTVTYSNLPDGVYEFMVMACNEDGIWNQQPATVSFTIRTPFWKTKWFIISAVLMTLLMIYLMFRYRIRQIRKRSAAEREKLMIEKSVIEMEQKSLRLQMNPHFIFNALNSIQSQIGSNNDQNARYYLAKFSHLMRQILDNSRQSSITLKEEIQTLENYLLIEKFSNGDHFDYSISTAANIETDFIEVPPMILQPFIENAIKHGVRHLKNKRGKIEVTIDEKDNVLICRIRDNGVGRKKSDEINKSKKDSYHQSTALSVTEERLKYVNEGTKFKSLQIVDIEDENGEAAGTEITIRIKLN